MQARQFYEGLVREAETWLRIRTAVYEQAKTDGTPIEILSLLALTVTKAEQLVEAAKDRAAIETTAEAA